jgi:hypothetical protein
MIKANPAGNSRWRLKLQDEKRLLRRALVVIALLANHETSFWLTYLHTFTVELSEPLGWRTIRFNFFRGHLDLMLAQWSGRGGGKHYGSSESLGFVFEGRSFLRHRTLVG